MQKVINKKVTKNEKVIKDIICNNCGKSCQDKPHSSIKEYNGLIEVEVSGGYTSSFIEDGTTWRFSICEKCLDSITKKFKIPVDIKNLDFSTEFVSLKKYKKLLKDKEKKDIFDWASAIRKINPNLKFKELIKKTNKQLRDIYYEIHSKQNKPLK